MSVPRKSITALVSLLAVIAVVGVAVARGADTAASAVDAHPPLAPEVGIDAPDHPYCLPIMGVLTGEAPTGNQFERAGLGNDRVPASLLAEWEIGSLTCSSTGMEKRVRSIFIDLIDNRGDTAALWLLLHSDEKDVELWKDELRYVARADGWDPVAYVVQGRTVLALRNARDHDLLGGAGLEPTVSMWDALQAAVEAGGPDGLSRR